jgi:peptidoglycan/LPS O-acetylase OafA/YrhL
MRFETTVSNLDILRTIAVSCVLGDHVLLFLTSHGEDPASHAISPLRLGRYGVLIFFVHTSLVLLMSLSRLADQPFARRSWEFYTRRIFRIYPLVWLVVLLCVFARIPSSPATKYVALDRLSLISNFALVQNLTHSLDVITPLWSLPFEMQMYLVLPVVFWSITRRSRFGSIVLCYAAAAAIYIFGQKFGLRGGYLFRYVPCFLAGALAFVLISIKRTSSGLPWWLWPALIASVGAAFVLLPPLEEPTYSVAGWVACVLLGLSIPWFRPATALLVVLPCKWIAQYSYGLYLFHLPVMWLVRSWLPDAGGIVRAPIALLLTAAVSFAVYHTLEAPMISLGRRLATRNEMRESPAPNPVLSTPVLS